jgi:UDPglucose 6-dehydrogenase
VSSINSISALCEITGANISEVALAVGTDQRIGDKFLQAGPGFGGSCFKKDILNLIYICNHYGLYEVSSYWQKVVDINYWQQKRISELIVNKLFGTVSDKKICILGFSFKANTNDTRESPAISICNNLLEEGANLYIYDPKVNKKQIDLDLKVKNETLNNETGKWFFINNIREGIIGADAIVLLTEWEEFKNLDWEEISTLMRSPSWLFDTRGICNFKEMNNYKIKIWSIGNGLSN